MSIPIDGTCRDAGSDDYEPIDAKVWHYYEKAKKLHRVTVAFMIIHGELAVEQIESDDRYAWLAD